MTEEQKDQEVTSSNKNIWPYIIFGGLNAKPTNFVTNVIRFWGVISAICLSMFLGGLFTSGLIYPEVEKFLIETMHCDIRSIREIFPPIISLSWFCVLLSPQDFIRIFVLQLMALLVGLHYPTQILILLPLLIFQFLMILGFSLIMRLFQSIKVECFDSSLYKKGLIQCFVTILLIIIAKVVIHYHYLEFWISS